METKDYLAFLVNEIHTTVVATVDSEGNPWTAAIDLMEADDSSLYFLTAKGKSFYNRVSEKSVIALTGMRGEDTMSTVSVSIRGKVRELGPDRLPRLFELNPYMNEIYPTEESRGALTVFQIYEGTGEWFDLSKKPIERGSFSFGEAELAEEGYVVTDSCIGCQACAAICPQNAIDTESIPVVIRNRNCIRCGNCFDTCPVGAIERR